MTLPADEHERRLREAREQLEAASELEGLKSLSGHRWRRRRQERAAKSIGKTDTQPLTPENTEPEPSNSLRRVRLRLNPEPLPVPDKIRSLYTEFESLELVARALDIDRHTAVKALAYAGIDIKDEIAKQWEAGSSLRELHERHGPGCDTISRWIKSTGREVQPRNANRQCDEWLIVETYLKTRSANRCAQAAGVSWEKARSILRKRGMWEK